MKVVTLSGAINAGAITPDMVINDPGFLYVGGYRIYDWDRRNHGNITYTYVLEHSLNVGAMKAMQAEGHANFYNYLQAFGLTKASGIDVAAEDTIPPPSAAKMADSQFATRQARPAPRRSPSTASTRSTCGRPTSASCRRCTRSSR